MLDRSSNKKSQIENRDLNNWVYKFLYLYLIEIDQTKISIWILNIYV